MVSVLFAVMCIVSVSAWGADNTASIFVRGIVRDSISDEHLPYASVVVLNGKGATVTDDNGIFEMSVPASATALRISCMGYDKKTVALKHNSFNIFDIRLAPSSTQLKEVVVTKRPKYSKKNNMAVDFAERLRRSRHITDPDGKPYYSHDKYDRITVGLNNFTSDEYRGLLKTFPFMAEYADTSEISDKPYLALLVQEKKSRRSHRLSPEATKVEIGGTRSAGLDQLADPASLRVYTEDVMREVNLYDNDINLLKNRFVSPLSPIAPDFYRFYLTDTVTIDADTCAVLSFYPRNKASFGFNGHVYVPVGDTTMFIKRVEMKTPRDINLNFVKNLVINQEYVRGPEGTRLKTVDNLVVELALPGQKNGIYCSRSTHSYNHSFDSIPDSVFAVTADVFTHSLANMRDEEYWDDVRWGIMPRGEKNIDELMARLRKVPVYYWGEKLLKILFSGYIGTANPSYFDFGPCNSIISFNDLETVRLRAGGMTTANLSKRWFGRGYVAYGFRDGKFKYEAEGEYSFIDKKVHSREFPVRSLRLTSRYDLYYPGETYGYTSPDNIVLSLKRMPDNRAFYNRLNKLEFNYETMSRFSVHASVANSRITPLPSMPLVDGYGKHYGSLTDNSLTVGLRYAPGEKVYQTRTYRIPVNLDAPSISLQHTYAPSGLGGTLFPINKTELSIAKRWWMSAFGYLDTYIDAAHVWQATSFLNLSTPNVNLSYTVQPRSFALMNPMEFMTTSNVGADITYWANGAILNCIPAIKKLKLREVFAWRGYWGRLADNCNPANDPSLLRFVEGSGQTVLDKGPYMEASAGLDNIFKVLRLDYVWRLNYLNTPYPIDRRGLRVAVHVTF